MGLPSSSALGCVSSRLGKKMTPGAGRSLTTGSRVSASPVLAFAATSEGWFRDARERVLRYPNGVERRIRYPQPSYPAVSYPAQGSNGASEMDGVHDDPYRSYAEGEDPTRWESFDVASLWDQTSARRTDAQVCVMPGVHRAELSGGSRQDSACLSCFLRRCKPPVQAIEVSDTSGELFAQLTSPDFRRQQQKFWQSVRESYQV